MLPRSLQNGPLDHRLHRMKLPMAWWRVTVNVPIGLGVAKVFKAGKVVFNIFAEPQFTVLAEGVGQPRYQTFVGFNTQF